MTRKQFFCMEWPGIVVLLILTAALPFLDDKPFVIFFGLALIGWMGLIPILIVSDKSRAEIMLGRFER